MTSSVYSCGGRTSLLPEDDDDDDKIIYNLFL